MKEEMVKQRLYEKYIAPTKEKRDSYIGIEIEMPIVNLNKQAVDFQNIHQVTKKFMKHFQFQPTGKDDYGNIYAASCEENGDILSYDCSFNNLELSMGRERELHTLYVRFLKYYRFLIQELGKFHYTLTGMGVNPYRKYNHNVPIENGRYRMLFHHLASYEKYDLSMEFHDYPAYGTFSSASQVQLDVDYDKLLTTINAFSKVEPIKALIFNNSVLLEEQEDLLCCRDMFWENSTHGINPKNIGMFERELHTIEELQEYIESTSIYCVEREDKYINFEPIKILDYFKKEQIVGEYYDDGVYKEITVTPQIEDIAYLRTFKFEDLTFRGTIEFRSVCCQPISDVMTVAAFHVGLKENLDILSQKMEEDQVIYHHGYTASELRKMFVKRKLPDFVNEEEVYQLAYEVVQIAEQGLKARGFGEEVFLKPLYERIQTRENPAEKLLKQREAGKSMEEIILEFGSSLAI